MRTRIIFSLKNRGAYVPFHHQYLLAQFIKGLLIFGPDKSFTGYTAFNFSGLKGQTRVSRKGLHFYSSKVTLVFACPDKVFLEYFIAQLFAQKDIMIGGLHLTPESIEDEALSPVGPESKFLCISPIVPIQSSFNDENGKKFVSPESDEFSDLLYESTLSRMEASRKFSPEKLASFYKFQIVPDATYLQRIQERRHQRPLLRKVIAHQQLRRQVRRQRQVRQVEHALLQRQLADELRTKILVPGNERLRRPMKLLQRLIRKERRRALSPPLIRHRLPYLQCIHESI